MRWIGKYLFRLIVLLAIGFVAYAMVAELPPPTSETTVSVPVPERAQ